jgi:hypothetical protein
MKRKAPKAKEKRYVVVRDSDDDDERQDVSIPQSRTIRISNKGLRILQTPLSPQKAASASRRSPSPEYEWNPSTEYDNIEEPLHELGGELLDKVSTVAEKVAAKRYPTSVSLVHCMSVAYLMLFRTPLCTNGQELHFKSLAAEKNISWKC